MSRTTTSRPTYTATFVLQLSLLLLTLFYSLSIHAAQSAGRLLFVRGEVQIISVDAEPREAKRGDLLQVGDTIRTGAASSAQLRMSDGAMIALKAGTEFRIEAQEYNAKAPGEGTQVGELVRGGLRAITGAIGHERPEAVKYRTPVATIGIRGTVFDTIYIPPEGLPELPGMAPGTYIMVLEGEVLLSTATGELLLGPGEVGYVPFIDAPPELRPDLAPVFVEFAAFEEPDGQKTSGGKDSYTRTAFTQQDNSRIYTLMADVSAGQILSLGTGATVSPGPYGIANISLPVAQGDFFAGTVTVGSNGELLSASGGGGISNYQVSPTNNGALNFNSLAAGDSTINWGQYSGLDMLVLDDVAGNPTGVAGSSTDFVNYITATNVIVNTADLPTTGSYTYTYQGGVATYAGSPDPGITSGSLTVNFGTAQMDVSLTADAFRVPTTYSASNQNISDFYGNGINLDSSYGAGAQNGSVISGRFVGSNAEGAVAGYNLFIGNGSIAGVAVFARR